MSEMISFKDTQGTHKLAWNLARESMHRRLNWVGDKKEVASVNYKMEFCPNNLLFPKITCRSYKSYYKFNGIQNISLKDT